MGLQSDSSFAASPLRMKNSFMTAKGDSDFYFVKQPDEFISDMI